MTTEHDTASETSWNDPSESEARLRPFASSREKPRTDHIRWHRLSTRALCAARRPDALLKRGSDAFELRRFFGENETGKPLSFTNDPERDVLWSNKVLVQTQRLPQR